MVITAPVDLSIGIAMVMAFLLGIYIGRLSGTFWLWAGLRSSLLAIAIIFLILLFN
jgi:VIT1/CCC1 family predicted Fe2+/Mn2+ transporter